MVAVKLGPWLIGTAVVLGFGWVRLVLSTSRHIPEWPVVVLAGMFVVGAGLWWYGRRHGLAAVDPVATKPTPTPRLRTGIRILGGSSVDIPGAKIANQDVAIEAEEGSTVKGDGIVIE